MAQKYTHQMGVDDLQCAVETVIETGIVIVIVTVTVTGMGLDEDGNGVADSNARLIRQVRMVYWE